MVYDKYCCEHSNCNTTNFGNSYLNSVLKFLFIYLFNMYYLSVKIRSLNSKSYGKTGQNLEVSGLFVLDKNYTTSLCLIQYAVFVKKSEIQNFKILTSF